MVQKVREAIQKYKPQIMMAYDSSSPWGYAHPDHVAAGQITARVVQGMQTKPECFLYGTGRPNTWVDVTDTISLKWKGLAAHKSQFGLFRMPFVKNQLLGKLARQEGRKIGVPDAEVFRRVDFKQDISDKK